eukprot:scaffold197267_cov33-Tisochrysis_lutea.AAC.2
MVLLAVSSSTAELLPQPANMSVVARCAAEVCRPPRRSTYEAEWRNPRARSLSSTLMCLRRIAAISARRACCRLSAVSILACSSSAVRLRMRSIAIRARSGRMPETACRAGGTWSMSAQTCLKNTARGEDNAVR